MKPEVRDAINNINRFIQQQKYIDISSNLKVEENVVARNLKGKDPEVVAEVMENLELIFKEISKVHNKGQADEYTERYYYLSDKIYDDIDKFKETYGDFAWAVSFAPADNPEIAICVMIPQGNTSTYALLPMKDIIGQYMGLNSKSSNSTANKTDEEKDDNSQEDSINFSTQLKK